MLLTRLTVRNFKRFQEASIELGNPVVFIGPNNSGKTTALQALALWDVGLKRWLEKRRGRQTSGKRPGVTINRRDIVALPVPDANLLWRALRVREGVRVDGKQQTKNIRIDIMVEGVSEAPIGVVGSSSTMPTKNLSTFAPSASKKNLRSSECRSRNRPP